MNFSCIDFEVLVSILGFQIGFGVFCLFFMMVGRKGSLHVLGYLQIHILSIFPLDYKEVRQIVGVVIPWFCFFSLTSHESIYWLPGDFRWTKIFSLMISLLGR